VLTVHEGLGWIAAAKLARLLRVPLHIILHDDWFRNLDMAGSLRRKFEAYFGVIYRAASSRFCISPTMEADYAARFGANGSVLYPIREPDTTAEETKPLVRDRSRGLAVAYAGNVFNPGNWEALRNVAAALVPFGGKLLLYGATSADDCVRNGLTASNVVLRGFFDPPALRTALAEEADVLFLPMTFDPVDKQNMRLCFPSKLADYTAVRLPLLIYGPEYCSAVQWARENPGAAEVVTEPGAERLHAAVERLSDATVRRSLSCRSSELGEKYFAYDAGTRSFHLALSQAATRSDRG
jgi:hypothetical protein